MLPLFIITTSAARALFFLLLSFPSRSAAPSIPIPEAEHTTPHALFFFLPAVFIPSILILISPFLLLLRTPPPFTISLVFAAATAILLSLVALKEEDLLFRFEKP